MTSPEAHCALTGDDKHVVQPHKKALLKRLNRIEGQVRGIDQGADDTTNAVSIRKFFQRTAGVAVTEATTEASIIQTRHRIPETALSAGQILVYQVPIPEPLRFLEPRETETRKMHELEATPSLLDVRLRSPQSYPLHSAAIANYFCKASHKPTKVPTLTS